MTYPHARKSRQAIDDTINVLWDHWVSILFKLLVLQSHAQLLRRLCAINDFEFSHEHDYSIDQRSIAFERMCCSLADLIQKIVKWCTENKDLQNLWLVSLVSYPKVSVDLTEFI